MKQMARPEWDNDDLDLTAWEWMKVAAGIAVVFVVSAAFLLLFSLAGPA